MFVFEGNGKKRLRGEKEVERAERKIEASIEEKGKTLLSLTTTGESSNSSSSSLNATRSSSPFSSPLSIGGRRV
jgi:hypothetical protein